MPEYDPLILRDELVDQLATTRRLMAERKPHTALADIQRFLDRTIADIDRWDQDLLEESDDA